MIKGIVLLFTAAWIGVVNGAGRAFPADSVNFVIEAFQRINRNIEYDRTNFLIDLSGRYAICKAKELDSLFSVPDTTDAGESVSGYVSDTFGDEGHVNAVIGYIQTVIDRWTFDTRSEIYEQIVRADYFGCSVRPKCNGRAVIACLFSPSERRYPFAPVRGPTTPYPIVFPPKRTDPPTPQPPIYIQGDQKAVAFTPEQYDVAEGVMGGRWDRDHFLENLSGVETRCEMLGADKWDWSYARQEAKLRNIVIVEQFGKARNKGETEPAMVKAMKAMKHLRGSARVGCSIIPDCMIGHRMWVVVGCIEEL